MTSLFNAIFFSSHEQLTAHGSVRSAVEVNVTQGEPVAYLTIGGCDCSGESLWAGQPAHLYAHELRTIARALEACASAMEGDGRVA